MSVYIPREDSFLMQIAVRDYAKGNVLDMGTGTGTQALTAAAKKNVKSVLAIDISKEAIEHCKRNIKNRKISEIAGVDNSLNESGDYKLTRLL